MKLLSKMPKSNPNLHSDLIHNGWIPLKEPKSSIIAFLLSLPLMIIGAIISIGIIDIISTISLSEFGLTFDSFSITIDIGIILMLATLLILHELLHLVFIPNFFTSAKTYVGITPLGGFVITEEEITKARYILISIAPFLIISIILPFVLSMLGILTTSWKVLIILNAMASSVDIFNLFLIMKQAPKDAILKSNGPSTYWRSMKA
ncbi:DUF3267 domain-containing protein [Gracilibacillus oryzae]|uniref:DUF3267 domain-containing protein n=1 Tax=Gracilibacillus oryzae TaxID=1672701 RepID=A0A7C8GRY8_9BACI|nr:DUF3267 domain-containing protein [Gracilibacillus oryzae]KAB8130502.1 DUF3267 domain-containing protein [Gracilibacillus oryzae]